LYQMAKADGIITDEKKQIYAKSYGMREPNYLNLLMTLSKGGHMSSLLLKLLISNPVVKILNSKPMKPFFRYLDKGLRGTSHLIKKLVKRA